MFSKETLKNHQQPWFSDVRKLGFGKSSKFVVLVVFFVRSLWWIGMVGITGSWTTKIATKPAKAGPKKRMPCLGVVSLSTPIRGLLSPILVRAVDWSLPSSNQTWLAGKSIINEGMMGNQLQMGDFPLPRLTTAGYGNK